jgi:hypothetical protein
LRGRGLMSTRAIDVGYARGAAERYRARGLRAGEISTTGAGRGSWQSRSAALGVSPTALRGGGAERVSDVLPVTQAWTGRRQMQHDAPHRGLHPDAELQELFTQGPDLGATVAGARGAQAQLLVEDVRGGAQQAVQLVRSISSAWCSSLSDSRCHRGRSRSSRRGAAARL